MKERSFKDYYKIFKRDITQYVDLKLDYLKLDAIESFSEITSKLIIALFSIFIGIIFVTFLLFALAFFLGDVLGQNYWGFLIVSGIFLLLALLFISFRRVILENTIVNALISSLFQKKIDKENPQINGKEK